MNVALSYKTSQFTKSEAETFRRKLENLPNAVMIPTTVFVHSSGTLFQSEYIIVDPEKHITQLKVSQIIDRPLLRVVNG
jgi:hypothetical protein